MTVSCTSCAVEQAPDARFCHRCGSPVEAPGCASCGADLVPGAAFCSRCGTRQPGTPAPAGAPPPAATERRVTSVLFADLVGFTPLSEGLDHEDVGDLLSRYFTDARTVIDRYGGTVEKFIGDAVMAVWGVPTAHEDDAERAVRAGLELVEVVDALGDLVGRDLTLRVGIVTGEVAVAVGARREGLVAGDAVNTAARIQGIAAPGEVWVDESTRLLTGAAITYADVGSHRLKGKADPVPLWSARAVVAAVGGAQRADGLEAPLVGRDRELRMLKALFHGAEETATPALVVVDGDPGTGKTRLAWEFEKYIDGLNTSVGWHSGRCLAYGEGVAFYALAEAVRGRLGVAAPDLVGTEDWAAQLEAGLATYVADEDERGWLRPRLGVLLGLASAGAFERDDLFSAWSTFLRRVGEEFPVSLVIDDGQYADDGMLQFLEHLIGLDDFACFVVLLTRPGLLERRPELATNRRATVVHIGPLTPRDLGAMLDGLVVGLPDLVRDRLVRRAEGVPLFAVETVRSLIDRDEVVPRGGQYVLADPEHFDVDAIGAPATLQALVAARLDALRPAVRRVVVQGSVLGTSFRREEIEALCGGAGPELDDALAELVRAQVLGLESSRYSSEFGQYKFVQDVVRQVAYATLSRRDRRTSHLRVARLLESGPDSAAEIAPIIAQHYLDALDAVPGEPDEPELLAAAVRHLREAAARARSLGAPAVAAAHLRVVLARATDPAVRAGTLGELAWALVDAGDNAEAVASAREAVRLFDEAGDAPAAGAAAAAQATALAGGLGDNQGAREVAEPRWAALAGRADAVRARILLARVIATARQRLGVDNADVLEERMRLDEQVGDQADLAGCFIELSRHYAAAGATTLTRVLLEAAADLGRRTHAPGALARALSDLTSDHVNEDLDKAVAYGREGVAAATAAGVQHDLLNCRLNLALALWSRGDWSELGGLPEIADPDRDPLNRPAWVAIALLVAQATGASPAGGARPDVEHGVDDPVSLGWNEYAVGLAALADGDERAALAHLMRSLRTFHDVYGVWDDLPSVWWLAADLAYRLADAEALATLQQMAGTDDSERVPVSLHAHRAHLSARLAAHDGSPPERVHALFRTAVDELDRWGSAPLRARAELGWAAWLAGQGRDDDAAAVLDRARSTLTELAASGWLAELDPDAESAGRSTGVRSSAASAGARGDDRSPA